MLKPVQIGGADEFFTDLVAKVEALATLDRPHPLSTALAVETLKSYLPEERHRIKLHELVMGEVESLAEKTLATIGAPEEEPSVEESAQIVRKLDAAGETAVALFAHAGFWSAPHHLPVWSGALSRIANCAFTHRGSGYSERWQQLSYYPSLALLYAAGVAAVAAGNYDLLGRLFLDVSIRKYTEEEEPLGSHGELGAVLLNKDVAQALRPPPPGGPSRTPLSDHLAELLQPVLRPLVGDQNAFDQAFDKFEYLRALVCVDFQVQKGLRAWGPLGRFKWHRRRETIKDLSEEADRFGDGWPALGAGLFNGSLTAFDTARTEFNEQLKTISEW